MSVEYKVVEVASAHGRALAELLMEKGWKAVSASWAEVKLVKGEKPAAYPALALAA